MPIYAYKCSVCGHTKDVLQKISDDPLTDCPACGAPAFTKQVTAAGFQLKGSGWYVTDFRDGGSKPATSTDAGSDPSGPAASSATGTSNASEGAASSGSATGSTGSSTPSTPSAPTPAASPASAPSGSASPSGPSAS